MWNAEYLISVPSRHDALNILCTRQSGQSINQSIKIYFLSSRNITVYTVYASAQKAAREAYAIKLAA